MRSLKLNFSDCLNFGLESENFRKFKTLLSESFGWNCARATRLTAVWDRAEAREGNNRHFALKFFERISLSPRPFLEILLRFDSENGKLSSPR